MQTPFYTPLSTPVNSSEHNESNLLLENYSFIILPLSFFLQSVQSMQPASLHKRLKVLSQKKIHLVFYSPTSQADDFSKYYNNFSIKDQKEIQQRYVCLVAETISKSTLLSPSEPSPPPGQQLTFSSPTANFYEARLFTSAAKSDHNTAYPLSIYQKMKNPPSNSRMWLFHNDPDFVNQAKSQNNKAMYINQKSKFISIMDLIVMSILLEEDSDEETIPKPTATEPLFKTASLPGAVTTPINPPDETPGEFSRWKLKGQGNSKMVYIARAKIILLEKNVNYSEIQAHSQSTKLSSIIYRELGCETLPVELINLPVNPKVPLQTMLKLKPNVKLDVSDIMHSLIKPSKKIFPYSKTSTDPSCASLLKENQINIQDGGRQVKQLGKMLAIACVFKDQDLLNQLNKAVLFEKDNQTDTYKVVKSITSVSFRNIVAEAKMRKAKPKQPKENFSKLSPGNGAVLIEYKNLNPQIMFEFDQTIKILNNTIERFWAKLIKVPDFDRVVSNLQVTNDQLLNMVKQRISNIAQSLSIDVEQSKLQQMSESLKQLSLLPQLQHEGQFIEFADLLQTNNVITLFKGDIADELTLLLNQMLSSLNQKKVSAVLIDVKGLTSEDISVKVEQELKKREQKSLLVLLFDKYQQIKYNHRLNIYREFNLKAQQNLRVFIACPTNYLLPKYQQWFQPEPADRNQGYWEVFVGRLPTSTLRQKTKNVFSGQSEWLQKCITQSQALTKILSRPIMFHKLYQLRHQISQIEEESAIGVMRFLFKKWYGVMHELPIPKLHIQILKHTVRELGLNQAITGARQVSLGSPEQREPFLYNQMKRLSLVTLSDSNKMAFVCEELYSYICAEIVLKELAKPNSTFKDIKIMAKNSLIKTILKEYVKYNKLEEELFRMVLNSRYGFYFNETQNSAGIAMTLLNLVEYDFSYKDLSFVHIPYAYLEGAVLENTNLRSANLLQIDISNAHLYNTNLKGALHSKRLTFGPEIQHKIESRVFEIFYLKDLKMIANIEGIASKFRLPEMSKEFDFNGTLSDPVQLIRYSPLGLLVGVSNNRDIKVWEVLSGAQQCQFRSRLASIQYLQIAGNLILSGRRGFEIEIWDIYTANKSKSILHKYMITCFAVVSASQIVLADESSNISVWSLPEALIEAYAQKSKQISDKQCSQIHADQNYVVAVCQQNTVVVYKRINSKQLTLHHTFTLADQLKGVKVCSNLGFYALLGQNSVRVNELVSNKTVNYLYDDQILFNWIHFNQSQKKLVITSNKGVLRINLKYSQPLAKQHQGPVTVLLLDEANLRLFSGSRDWTIKVWSLATFQLQKSLHNSPGEVTHLLLHDRLLVSVQAGSDLSIWAREKLEHLFRLRCHSDSIRCLGSTFTQDILFTGCEDKLFRLFKYNRDNLQLSQFKLFGVKPQMEESASPYNFSFDKKDLSIQEYHDKLISCAAHYRYQNFFITGSDDCRFIMWDEQGFKAAYQLHSSPILSLLVLQKGKCISTCKSSAIKVWNPENGSLLMQLKHLEQGNPVYLVGYIPEVQLLVHFNQRGLVKMSPLDATKKLEKDEMSYMAHNRRMLCVALDQTRKLLITGSTDMSIKALKYSLQQNKISYSKSLPKRLLIWHQDPKQRLI